jgi:hypothetical protein
VYDRSDPASAAVRDGCAGGVDAVAERRAAAVVAFAAEGSPAEVGGRVSAEEPVVTADQFLVLSCRRFVGVLAEREEESRGGGEPVGVNAAALVPGTSCSASTLLVPPAVVREVRAGVWKATA